MVDGGDKGRFINQMQKTGPKSVFLGDFGAFLGTSYFSNFMRMYLKGAMMFIISNSV